MLKPGSNKLKESEAEIIKELHMFEEQEDKTLKNFEMETKKQEENDDNSQEQKIEEVEQGIYIEKLGKTIYRERIFDFPLFSLVNEKKSKKNRETI